MKVVSLVPSLTETLIESGVEVIGCTRYCVHPRAVTQRIPKIGGTKAANFEDIRSLAPDLVIFDKEENPKEFAFQLNLPWVATHVRSIETLIFDLIQLQKILNQPKLQKIVDRWEGVQSSPKRKLESWKQLPGVLDWVQPPMPDQEIKSLSYVIWKEPWMQVSRETFIGDVLGKFSLNHLLVQSSNRYPKFELDSLDSESHLLLFSTEPYPFHKRRADLGKLPFPSAIVDGELFSWFGIRSLRFLERALSL